MSSKLQREFCLDACYVPCSPGWAPWSLAPISTLSGSKKAPPNPIHSPLFFSQGLATYDGTKARSIKKMKMSLAPHHL